MQKNWRVRIGVSSDADCLIGRRGFFNQSQNVVEWMPQARVRAATKYFQLKVYSIAKIIAWNFHIISL